MPMYSIRANLASPLFPFTTEFWGRSIIVPQYDENFDRTTLNAPGVVIDKGIPQTYYMHNCLPTPQGYQAVGYKQVLPDDACNSVVGQNDFDVAFPLQNANGNKFLFVPAAGKNYIFDAQIGRWMSISPFAVGRVTSATLVTTAFVQGQTYIYYALIGCFIYDDVNKVLTPVTLTALDTTKVLGIAAASGYMIAFTKNNVAWSSLTTPTDFTPDLSTGAGGGAVSDQKGDIVACLPISGGFIVYCQINAVAARFSGNILFPFIFKEIPGSAGIVEIADVSWHSNLAYHLVWNGAGIQQLTLGSTTQLYPEATDFLAGEVFEDFDESSNSLSTSYLLHPLDVSVAIISSRYFVLSYGVQPGEFTHALVFDLELSRWGKLKVNHRNCFQYTFPNLFGPITYGQLTRVTYGDLAQTTYGELGATLNSFDSFKHSLAFLQADGEVLTVDFSFGEEAADGVLILGKYQFIRMQRLEHQMTEVDIVRPDAEVDSPFALFIIPTQDGKTFQAPVPTFQTNAGLKTRQFRKIINAQNLSFLFRGAFNLTSVNFEFTLGGYTK